jgi:hypothetical protein
VPSLALFDFNGPKLPGTAKSEGEEGGSNTVLGVEKETGLAARDTRDGYL